MDLIRNCPVLEDVSIRRYLEHNVSNVDLCIPQLTSVDLLSITPSDVGLDLQIEAPIKDLTLSLYYPGHNIIIKNPDSLIQADITIIMLNYDVKSPEQQGQQDYLLKILKTVDKVKCLTLNDCYSVIKTSIFKLLSFSNLIRLEVRLECNEFYMLGRYLNSATNLKILVIKKGWLRCSIRENGKRERRCRGDGIWLNVLSTIPKCMIASLKRVEIIDSIYCTGEFKMLQTMLKYAKVLEKLVTKPHPHNRKDIDSLRQKISAFPRASASCQFEFPS